MNYNMQLTNKCKRKEKIPFTAKQKRVDNRSIQKRVVFLNG